LQQFVADSICLQAHGSRPTIVSGAIFHQCIAPNFLSTPDLKVFTIAPGLPSLRVSAAPEHRPLRKAAPAPPPIRLKCAQQVSGACPRATGCYFRFRDLHPGACCWPTRSGCLLILATTCCDQEHVSIFGPQQFVGSTVLSGVGALFGAVDAARPRDLTGFVTQCLDEPGSLAIVRAAMHMHYTHTLVQRPPLASRSGFVRLSWTFLTHEPGCVCLNGATEFWRGRKPCY
jgi:hypothetical protein